MGVAGTVTKTGTVNWPGKNKKRKHIWEIDSRLFCPVCGTCLDMEEQKEILKKLKMNPDLYNDYEIHGLMVQSLNSKNKLSYQLDRHLNRKYRYEISEFGGYEEKELLKKWQEKLDSGDICGLFWVAVTQPQLSWESLFVMFCEVHMLSHLNGGSARREKAECKRLTGSNARLSERLKEEKKAKKILNRELEQSKNDYRQLEARLQNLNKQKDSETENRDGAVKGLEQEKHELKTKLCQAQEEVDELMKLIRLLNREKDNLILELSEQKEINIQLYREIENVLKQLNSGTPNCGKTGLDFDLCARRVLIVGGLTKLKGFYRDMIEKMGGEFEYHDGYLQSGAKTLEDSIKRSDIILCPVDFNSHGACLNVKRICKKFNKSYQILAGSSLNSISQALTAGGESC